MAEWLDPENLEDPENTTPGLLNELAQESDHVLVTFKYWSVGADVGSKYDLVLRFG
jgi:hypothetical protein